MRKLFILPMIASLFFMEFGAFAATARGVRGTSSAAANNTGNAPVAARAAVRGGVKKQTSSSPAAAPVAARAAVRNTPKVNTVTTSKSTAAGGVAARAGAKQKVISMGTKISTATANTVVSQECQDAYFGCMDAFCMLENTTGGRCKCSDKNAEYDNMLAEIMKLDQQSYVMQTEGVSLLKMGKSADEVYAMAQSAADKVSGVKKEPETTKKNKLDMSAWNKDFFNDDIEFDEFEESPLEADLTSKTGDKLHSTAAAICTQQAPSQCKASVSMLRMLYVQKIQSDCAAYENSLKQQQLESTQKMQTARQSLRDTALEKYQESNKYDLGGCVREYNACMQKEETCGEGFLGCVTFAATDNLKNDKSGTVAKQTTIKGSVSSITLAATTLDQLLSKRVFCEGILEQCVNVKDQVWDAFLKSAAPAIKTAESDSEDKLRRNCIGEVSSCFQTECKEQMDPNNPDGSYDMCLSDPELYKSLCKPKLEPCLLATGGTYDKPEKSSLWTALKARLASMKVDACTKEVKECLLSEDRCGKDYAGCIGLSTADIGELCPAEKLTACMEKNDADTVREYVARVAQGIALNIDNNMLTHCQTALKTAMLTFCGAEDTCPNAAIDENMFKDIMSVQMCPIEGLNSKSQCSTDPYTFSDQNLIDGKITPMLIGKVDLSAIEYQLDNASSDVRSADAKGGWNQSVFKSLAEVGTEPFGKIQDKSYTAPGKEPLYSDAELNRVIRTLNTNFKTIVNSVESDPKVVYCTSGRKVQGFDENSPIGVASGKNNARFPNLTQNVRAVIAQQLLVATSPVYFETQQKVFDEQIPGVKKAMFDRVGEIVASAQDKQKAINRITCMSLKVKTGGFPDTHWCDQSHWNSEVEYNEENNTCTKRWKHWKRNGCGIAFKWLRDEDKDKEKTVQMPTLDRSDLRGDGNSTSGIKDAIDAAQTEADSAVDLLDKFSEDG